MTIGSRLAAVAGGLVLVVKLAGCGVGSSSTEPAAQAVTRQGGVSGYAYTSSTRQAQSDITLTSTATAPQGTTPLQGATVTMSGSDGSATTEADGSFTFRGALSGLRKLTITPAGGTAVQIPVTVIGGSTITVGAPTVTRSQALDAVKADVAAGQALDTVFILGPQHPLPAGVRVEPALGNDDGDFDPALVTTLAKPTWFFFVDLDPHARFQHAVKFYFVDPETAELTSIDATSWPSINGLNFYGLRDINIDSQDTLQKPDVTAAVSPSRALPVPLARNAGARDHVANCPSPSTYALLVQGSDESAMRADIDRITEFFGHGGIPPATVFRFKPPSQTPSQDVRALWDRICQQAQPCDTVFVYITAHGTRGGAAKLDSTAVDSNGIPADFDTLPASSFQLSKCKACHIIFVIDSCYSGRWIDNFKRRQTEPPTSRKITVMTASDARHESVAIPTWDPRGTTGSKFTTELVSAFSGLVQANPGGTVDIGQAFDNANTAIAGTVFPSAVRRQNPQYYLSWNQQPCGAPTAGGGDLIRLAPTQLSATHTVGSSPCPQSLGTLTVHNVSSAVVAYSATVNNTVFALSGSSGQLQPGASVNLGVSFNCGGFPPQSGSVTVVGSAESGATQTLTAQISLAAGG